MKEQTWKPTCDVSHLGPTPNVFDLVGCVGLTLKRLNRPNAREAFQRRVMKSVSYHAALDIMKEYVELAMDE